MKLHLPESPNVVQDVSLYAFNATSITVAFSPPENPELVSALNGYIIHYTNRTSENVDVSQWEKLTQVGRCLFYSNFSALKRY